MATARIHTIGNARINWAAGPVEAEAQVATSAAEEKEDEDEEKRLVKECSMHLQSNKVGDVSGRDCCI
jgi:hypothetical protein